MPLIRLPDHRSIPRLDEPASIVGLTILVSVQCKCGTPTALGLINAQPAVCDACGVVFTVDAVSWEKGSTTPRIALSSSPSLAQALTS
jgi:hypothetical protein